MFKKLWMRYVYLNEAGGDTGGSGAGAAPAAGAPSAGAGAAPDGAAAPAGDNGLTPPGNLLADDPAGAGKEGEPKPEGEKPAGTAEPIEYTDFKLPEGIELAAEKLGEFKALAAKGNMSQEIAQEMVDFHLAEIKQIQEAPYRAWNELQTKWRDEVKNDPVIGGANLDKNLAATKSGLQALLGNDAPKFFEALNVTGAGNNPDIVRGLMKAAAPHAPAQPVSGSPGGAGQKTAGATLYPTQVGLGNGHQ